MTTDLSVIQLTSRYQLGDHDGCERILEGVVGLAVGGKLSLLLKLRRKLR